MCICWSPTSTTPPRLLNFGKILSTGIASTSRNRSIITSVDRGEMHANEIRRLSVILIISPGKVPIRKVDRVRPEWEWMRWASGDAGERPVNIYHMTGWSGHIEQLRRTVNGSSMSLGSKSSSRPQDVVVRRNRPDSRSQKKILLPKPECAKPTLSAGECLGIQNQIDTVGGSTVCVAWTSCLSCWLWVM